MSEIGAWTLDATFAEGLRERGALVALVFFRGLPLPFLTEGAVGLIVGLRRGKIELLIMLPGSSCA